MAGAEIEVDLSQFAAGSIVDATAGLRLSQRSATREPALTPQEDDVDEAALEALMQQAQAFAPLDQRAHGAEGDREDEPKQDALGLTTLEDTAASSEPPPRGHLAVIDRLYKWERRRSAKLDKARRDEQQRQSKEEESHCTFSPKVARPTGDSRHSQASSTVSQQSAPTLAQVPDRLAPPGHGDSNGSSSDAVVVSAGHSGSTAAMPSASPSSAAAAAPSTGNSKAGSVTGFGNEGVVDRLQRWQDQREARRRQMISSALQEASKECTFSPSISSKAKRSAGKVTALLREIDEHEAAYSASIAGSATGSEAVVAGRQSKALDTFMNRKGKAAKLRDEKRSVPHADGRRYTGRTTKPRPPNISDFTGAHMARRTTALSSPASLSPRAKAALDATVRAAGRDDLPPTGATPRALSPVERGASPQTGAGVVAVGQAHGMYAGDVADTLAEVEILDGDVAEKRAVEGVSMSRVRQSAMHEWAAVDAHLGTQTFGDSMHDHHSQRVPNQPPATAGASHVTAHQQPITPGFANGPHVFGNAPPMPVPVPESAGWATPADRNYAVPEYGHMGGGDGGGGVQYGPSAAAIAAARGSVPVVPSIHVKHVPSTLHAGTGGPAAQVFRISPTRPGALVQQPAATSTPNPTFTISEAPLNVLMTVVEPTSSGFSPPQTRQVYSGADADRPLHRHGSHEPPAPARGPDETEVRVPASVMLQRARVVEAATQQRKLYAEAAEAAAAGSMSVGATQPLEALRERMKALRAELEAERTAAAIATATATANGLPLQTTDGIDAVVVQSPSRRTPPKPPSATSSPQRVQYQGSSPAYRTTLPVARTGADATARGHGGHGPRSNIETVQQQISARMTAARHRSIADHVDRHAKLRATQH